MGIHVNWNKSDYNSLWDLYTESIKRGFVKKYLDKNLWKNQLPPSSVMLELKEIEILRMKGFEGQRNGLTDTEMIEICKDTISKEYHNWGMKSLKEMRMV